MSVRKQRGAALIAAVLVVALATVLIAAMLDRSEAALARTRNLQRAEQGWELMRGVEAWAGEILKKDFNEAPNIDSRLDIWNQEMPPIDLCVFSVDSANATGASTSMPCTRRERMTAPPSPASNACCAR